jgi:hypothetical protein
MSFVGMSYVLEQTKQQQVLALGQLGWTVSRIATAVRVDRATVTRYLRAAGLPVRGRGRPSEGTANAAITPEVSTGSGANPAISQGEVSTDVRPARALRTLPMQQRRSSTTCSSSRERGRRDRFEARQSSLDSSWRRGPEIPTLLHDLVGIPRHNRPPLRRDQTRA